jgi:ESCRT-II complex subunit VPS36
LIAILLLELNCLFSLQSKAKEMMQLAENMRLKLLTNSSTQSNSGDEEMGSKQDMQDWLLSVGIVSPVTKETAGALYHQQLSLQVIDSHFHSLFCLCS